MKTIKYKEVSHIDTNIPVVVDDSANRTSLDNNTGAIDKKYWRSSWNLKQDLINQEETEENIWGN